MKIFSWNVNGLRAIAKKGFFDFIKKESPDILCIQETKVSFNQLPFDLKIIDSYEGYFNEGQKLGYSGVAIYTKIKPHKVITNFGDNLLSQEGRTIQLDFTNFSLINCYFPNGKASPDRLNYKMRFYDQFLQYILDQRKIGKKIIFCGDVNTAHKEIDLARPKENETISGFLPTERQWLDKVIKNNYFDIFRKFNQQANQYSWWSQRSGARVRNVGWRIDYFFADKKLENEIVDAKIHPQVMGSDHCPISISLSLRGMK